MLDSFEKGGDKGRPKLQKSMLYAALYNKKMANMAKLNYSTNIKNLSTFVDKGNLGV